MDEEKIYRVIQPLRMYTFQANNPEAAILKALPEILKSLEVGVPAKN